MSLWLAAAYTSYGSADKIILQLTAYEVYGGLWRLTAAAMGSMYGGLSSVKKFTFLSNFDCRNTEKYIIRYPERCRNRHRKKNAKFAHHIKNTTFFGSQFGSHSLGDNTMTHL